jgi:hypothetical protein
LTAQTPRDSNCSPILRLRDFATLRRPSFTNRHFRPFTSSSRQESSAPRLTCRTHGCQPPSPLRVLKTTQHNPPSKVSTSRHLHQSTHTFRPCPQHSTTTTTLHPQSTEHTSSPHFTTLRHLRYSIHEGLTEHITSTPHILELHSTPNPLFYFTK